MNELAPLIAHLCSKLSSLVTYCILMQYAPPATQRLVRARFAAAQASSALPWPAGPCTMTSRLTRCWSLRRLARSCKEFLQAASWRAMVADVTDCGLAVSPPEHASSVLIQEWEVTTSCLAETTSLAKGSVVATHLQLVFTAPE